MYECIAARAHTHTHTHTHINAHKRTQTHTQLVSDQKLVSVNIYYSYFGQLNPKFPYSEAEYLTKCDLIASAVNQWGQAAYVRAFCFCLCLCLCLCFCHSPSTPPSTSPPPPHTPALALACL